MKRLWGIRHLRWLYYAWQLERWARHWAQLGIGLGYPNQSDIEVLNAIWRGER